MPARSVFTLLASLCFGIDALWAAPPNVLVFLTDDQGWADAYVNLTDDPPESVNHAAAHPEIVRRLEQFHEAWAKDVFQTYAP